MSADHATRERIALRAFFQSEIQHLQADILRYVRQFGLAVDTHSGYLDVCARIGELEMELARLQAQEGEEAANV